jgi:hypothetical protein
MILLSSIRETLKRNHVTFAELSRLEGFWGPLDLLINHEKASNVVIWSGMSQEAVDALWVIQQEGEYEMVPTTALTYLIDGVTLNLPIAKSARHYKKPRWAPTVLRKKLTAERKPAP